MAKPRNGGGGGPSDTEVESNLTSMLDLIFNVLAFFVVTFNPPKPEKNFDVALPPPKQEESQSTQELPDLDQEPELFDALTITLAAGPGGALAAVNVDGAPVDGGLNGLSRDLRIKAGSIGGVTGKKLETATVVASPTLKYRYLIQAVDACHRAEIKKINFTQQGGSGGGGSGGGGGLPF